MLEMASNTTQEQPESLIKVEEVEEKKKTTFEAIYKSKAARALALATALFGAGVAEKIHHDGQHKEKAAAIELLEKEGYKLEDIASKFKLEAQVPGGENTILHLAQLHHSQEADVDPKLQKDVIDSQKNIGQLLSYLAEKGMSDTVYVEGVTPQYLLSLDDVRNLVAQNQEKSKDNVFEDSLLVINTAFEVQGREPTTASAKKAKADWLYAAKCELENECAKIKTEYEIFLKTGHADERYEKTFTHLGRNVISSIDGVRKEARAIGQNELLRGDNVYYWGAAEKLYAEGKIKLKSAGDKTADEKTMAPNSLVEDIVYMPGDGQKPVRRHRIREDATLTIIGQDTPQEKIIPLVYGAGHNFTESVTAFNKDAGSAKFGLTKLTPETGSK